MSVNYFIQCVDWDAYASFVAESLSLSDSEFCDAEDEFQSNHVHPSSSIFSSTCWRNVKYGLSSFDIYSSARNELDNVQRGNFDLLFSTVNDHSRLYGKWMPDFERVVDVTFSTVPESLIAAMNPDSVNRLLDLWGTSDMNALTQAVNQSVDFRSPENQFEGIGEYLVYVSGWGILLKESSKFKRGIVIGTAI